MADEDQYWDQIQQVLTKEATNYIRGIHSMSLGGGGYVIEDGRGRVSGGANDDDKGNGNGSSEGGGFRR
ncbi:hypothetical protein Ancab_029351 [Ancistrocladus abbreviatus]